MDEFTDFSLLIPVLVVLAVLAAVSVRILREYERGVVFTLGTSRSSSAVIAARSWSCCGPRRSDGSVQNSAGYNHTGFLTRSAGSQS